MQYISFLSVVAIICSFFAVSCNSDIFIDKNLDLPDETVVFVDGDNGHAEVSIQPKGLEYIYIDYIGGDVSPWKYYDARGNEVDWHSPASEISEIYYFTPFCEFSIGILGDKIYLNSMENCTGKELNFNLRLEYDYAVKYIMIHIMEGKPLELLYWHYDEEIQEIPNIKTGSRSLIFDNRSSSPAVVHIKPYQDVPVRACVEPEASWAKDINISLSVPVYSDDEWIYVDCPDIQLGSVFCFSSFDMDKSVPVTIPGNSKAEIRCTVNFSQIMARGELEFLAPVYGREHDTRFTCKVIQPMSYKIDIIWQ